MNVIKFPGTRRRMGDEDSIARAVRLKQRLIDFVLEGPVRTSFDEQWEIDGIDGDNTTEAVDFVDWFIFEWTNEEGVGVIDEFLERTPDLDPSDRAMADGWADAIDDLFRVEQAYADGFDLADGEGNVYFTVPTNATPDELGWEPGSVVGTRILPVDDFFILSGAQTYYSDEADDEPVDDDVSVAQGIYDGFVAHFGAPEVDIPLRDLPSTMTGLRDFLANEYVHPTLERAIGEASDVLAGPDLAALEDMMKEYGDMSATIVADPAGGLALVPGYPDVREYLATGDGDAVEMAQAIAAFLGERSVPSFVVRRLAAVNPERFERLVGSAIRDDSFKVETDLDDLIDELKPEEYTADSLEMDDEVLTPDDLEDVRTLPAELRAEGTIAAAAVAFLNDPVTVKLGRTIDELARSLSLLTYYGDIYSSSLLSDLDRQTLIDFLAAWYPRSWSERGEDDALSLLGSLELFARWLTAHDASPVGETFINEVLPELERDLPRTVEAAVVLDAGITAADLTDLVDDEDEAVAEDAIDGLFEIAMIDLDENVLTLIERFEGDEQEQIPTPGYEIEVPLRAAALLECSDLIDGVIVRRDGVWKLVDVAAVYCAVADV